MTTTGLRTPCIGCGRPVPVGTGGRCSRCRPAHRRYRSSSAWDRERKAAKAGQVCAICGSPGPLEAHHPLPLASGLAAALARATVPLCGPCHDMAHGKRPRTAPSRQEAAPSDA